MAFLIIADKQHEIDRVELTGAIVIGRSPECDVSVRDVLLSRRHCRIEPHGSEWAITDLQSKNGTFIEGQKIDRQVLADSDVIRAGRTRMIFRAGKFVPPPPDVVQRKAARRPADPIEALSGTITGFELSPETDMEEHSRITGFPIPRPKSAEEIEANRENAAKVKPRQRGRQSQPSSSPWDLELREQPTGSTTELAHQPVMQPASPPQRQRLPSKFAATPNWVALIYVILAYLLCALVLWMVMWR